MSALPAEWLACYPSVNSGKALLVVHSLDGVLDTGLHGALRCLNLEYINKYTGLHLTSDLRGVIFFHEYKSIYWMGLTIKESYNSQPNRGLIDPLIPKLKLFADKNKIDEYILDSSHAFKELVESLDASNIKYRIVESNELAYFEEKFSEDYYNTKDVK